jgi:hypothetical protein
MLGTGDRSRRLQKESSAAKNQENAMSSSERPERRPIIPARQARQGVTGHNVRLVLGLSVTAGIIVLAIIWMVYFA